MQVGSFADQPALLAHVPDHAPRSRSETSAWNFEIQRALCRSLVEQHAGSNVGSECPCAPPDYLQLFRNSFRRNSQADVRIASLPERASFLICGMHSLSPSTSQAKSPASSEKVLCVVKD